MRPGGGKGKGSEFERKTCKELSLWVSGGTRKDLFWRSAMSGGRATLGLRRGEVLRTQAGDVSGVHPLGHALVSLYVIECKHYKDLQLAALVTRNEGELINFWRKTCAEAVAHKKNPMMIAKQNNRPTLLCLDSKGAIDLNLAESIGNAMVQVWLRSLFIYSWGDFLDWADPKVLEHHNGREQTQTRPDPPRRVALKTLSRHSR